MRRTPLNKKSKSTKTTLCNKADALCKKYIKSIGRCEAEGYNGECSQQLQWCHVKTRGAKSIRHDPLNSLCMCAKHHFYFHHHPDQFGEFLDSRWPDRRQRLQDLWNDPNKKPDYEYWIDYYKRNPSRSE